MSEAKRKLVFISHASADASKAGELCKALEALGFGCWIAPRDIDPGKQYGEEIIHGIESTDGLVLMLSKTSNQSPHVRDEAERAKHYGKRVIPFRIEDIAPSKSLEFYIATSQWIDAFGNKWGDGVDLLATTISKMANQPPPPKRATPKTAASDKRPMGLIVGACAAVAVIGFGIWAVTHDKGSGEGPSATTGNGSEMAQGQNTPATVSSGEPGERGVRLAKKSDVHLDAGELVPKYHALVIGINEYADFGTKGWSDLQTARNDAQEVAKNLNESYGFDVKLLVDKNATRANIMQELDTIATEYPDDAILIYYAGHGYYKEDQGQGYWIPSDARKDTEDGHPAKQDWIWNSTIQEMLGSTKSKHVLLIADSCFSGSLFRGAAEETLMDRKNQWYRRAIKNDSRYLITSGDLEPVMDGGGGGGHSIFASMIINYLRNSEGDLFSASDMAQAVREGVSTRTGQLVRMGHLPAAAHGGGEFVFLKSNGKLPTEIEVVEDEDKPVIDVAEIQQQVKPRGKTASFQAAMDMQRSGLTNTAINVLASWGDDKYAKALTAELTQKQDTARRERLDKLIDVLEKRKAEGANEKGEAYADYARPRVLALWQQNVPEGMQVDPATLKLINIYLTTELGFSGKIQLVEREQLNELLEEQSLGSSELADDKASLEIGKLLPASLVLMGDIIPDGEENVRLMLRMVDTETTRILSSFKGASDAENELADVVQKIGEDITRMVVRARPLTARVLAQDGDTLRAAAGQFHGVSLDTEWELIQRTYPDATKPDDFRETKVGTAIVANLGEETSDIEPTFTVEGNTPEVNTLWVTEKRSSPKPVDGNEVAP